MDITQKVSNQEIKPDSKEYKNALKDAFGNKLSTDQKVQKSVGRQQTAGSICGIVEMLTVLGALSKLTMVATATDAAISALGATAGSAAVGAVQLGGYTAFTEGINLWTRKADVTGEDWKTYG